ncbi:MAG: hypothetical protein ACK4OP_06660, partial [Gemmobacter sp.]
MTVTIPAGSSPADLRLALAMQRPMTSLLDRAILSVTAEFAFDTENWVRMWVDPGHAVASDCGQCTATRGITTEGRLLWLVRHRDKAHGYHSAASCPFDAIAEAEWAWAERRRVRRNWAFVESLRRDLVAGRRRMTVEIDDAHRSALCATGIEAFMRRIGLGRVQRVSGRVAALMMLIEPQVGFVLAAAWERQHGPIPEAGTDSAL